MRASLNSREEQPLTAFMNRRRTLLHLGIAGTIVVTAALVFALVSGLVRAADAGGPASNWHIGSYTTSPHGTLSFADAPTAASGIASLNFTGQPNTALLVTYNKAKFPSLLGDLSGKSVFASFTVSGLTTGNSFIYFGEPDACGGTIAYVRYYFETSNAGGFDETHFWWSNPVAAALSANGPVSLATVPLAGANWSDFYGHFGNDPAYSAGFNAAVANVTRIGLSFGGGCFFENGVGTTDGSGALTLNSYAVS
jgi:hypothetical protein